MNEVRVKVPLRAVTVEALEKPNLVTDAIATRALREFFQLVLDTGGVDELRQVYESFYMQCHGELPLRRAASL